MTSEQALHAYHYSNGYRNAVSKPHTLGERIKKYFKDNAYYFYAGTLGVAGRPATSSDFKVLEDLRNWK